MAIRPHTIEKKYRQILIHTFVNNLGQVPVGPDSHESHDASFRIVPPFIFIILIGSKLPTYGCRSVFNLILTIYLL
jgi:hypothetical protein